MYFWAGTIFALLVVWGLITTKDTAKIRQTNTSFALFILGIVAALVVMRLLPLIQLL